MIASTLNSRSDGRAIDADSISPRIAYIMSRFPKITETFILYEMLAAEKAGVCVEAFPLSRETTGKMHPEAVAYVKRAHFLPLLSVEILRDNLVALLQRPSLWLKTLFNVVRANLGSRRFLIGALAVFPKCITIARRMQELQIDHIHAHFASHPAAAAWIIHQFSGIPYSFVAHGSDLHRDQHMLREKVRDAAFVVAISDYNRRIILDVVCDNQAAKVTVIHCGVNPVDFSSAHDSAHRPVGATGLNILCIGTLHEVKGQRYLIEAFGRARANRHDLTLHLVGDGPDQKILEQQVAAAGLTNHVIFEGRRDRHEIIGLLRTADVLVTPSVSTASGRREGIPVVLMEAMASGVPVIASRLSGIPELVQDQVNGLLAEPRDVEGLVRAIELLCDNPELRTQLGDAGRRTVEEDFNMEASVGCLLRKIRSTMRDTHIPRLSTDFPGVQAASDECEVSHE